MMVAASRILPGQTGHSAGRALLTRMHRQLTGEELPPIAVTERGKPYFPGNPRYFSISHTDRHVFCVLSDRPVGIDAEELTRTLRPELAKRILSEGEWLQYEQAPDRNLALLQFWVLKEAQVKCTGEGLRGYPNRTDFSLTDPRLRIMNECVVAIIEEDDHVI